MQRKFTASKANPLILLCVLCSEFSAVSSGRCRTMEARRIQVRLPRYEEPLPMGLVFRFVWFFRFLADPDIAHAELSTISSSAELAMAGRFRPRSVLVGYSMALTGASSPSRRNGDRNWLLRLVLRVSGTAGIVSTLAISDLMRIGRLREAIFVALRLLAFAARAPLYFFIVMLYWRTTCVLLLVLSLKTSSRTLTFNLMWL